MSRGILTVISGFSGAGKGTLMRKLTEDYDNYALSVSMTTRAPREGERDGIEYFFVDTETFQERVRQGRMLEYACYCGNYYGTPRDYVRDRLDQGRDVILEIEIQGALQVKKLVPDCLLLFVTPPCAGELRRRLEGRGTETPEVIARRLARAAEEIRGCLGRADCELGSARTPGESQEADRGTSRARTPGESQEADRGTSRDRTPGESHDPAPDDGPRIFYGDIYDALRGQVVASNPHMDDFACYRNVPCHQACIYHHSLFAERGYEPIYRVRADYEHFLWCFFRGHARPRYIPVTLASYEGGGFSETPENRKRSAREHREITALYMSRGQRLRYRLILLATLAPLRTRMAESPVWSGLYNTCKKRIYRRE